MACTCSTCERLDAIANRPSVSTVELNQRIKNLETELTKVKADSSRLFAEWTRSEKKLKMALNEIRGLSPQKIESAPDIADRALKEKS